MSAKALWALASVRAEAELGQCNINGSVLPSLGAWVLFEVKPAQLWRPRKCCDFLFLPTGMTTPVTGLRLC